MKLKSFKKKGVSPETAAWELLPEHYNYRIEQIAVDSKQQAIEIMWPYENGGPNLERGDTLAVTIDGGPNILLAKIRKVSMVGDQLLQASIQEHKELDIQSSKQLPSSRWTRFLKELKKKCDSGHHNKKRKTLLHVIKMAKSIEATPESMQLRIRPRLTQENNILNAQAGTEPEDQQLRNLVKRIEEAKAAYPDASFDLEEIGELLLSPPSDVVVVDANHVPEQTQLEAMTIVLNEVPLRTSKTSNNKQLITIPGRYLEKAFYYNTQQNPYLNEDDSSLYDLLDTKQRRVSVYVYSHNDDSIVYDNTSVRYVTTSSSGDLVLELQDSLDAGLRQQWVQSVREKNLDSVLLTINSFVPEDAPNDNDVWSELENNKMLKVSPDMYKLESDSNTNKKRIKIKHTFEASSQFQPGDTYFVGVGNLHAAVTVDSVWLDGVTEEPKKAQILFSHKGGTPLESLEAERIPETVLTMKRLEKASPPRNAAIQLTLEHVVEPAVESFLPDANPKPLTPLVDIADGIDAFIEQYEDGISVDELLDWSDEKTNPVVQDLIVTGVEYQPTEQGYYAESSVTGGFEIDVWRSADRAYSLFDIEPEQLANVESVVHSSTIGDDEDEMLPKSEVKQRIFFAGILEEVRRALAEVDPLKQYAIWNLSIYNEDGGHAVCNNEEIHKILRKKKDGKCIYRIVVKNSVRANRIYHGKHRKCIIYLDRLYRVTNPVF
jgi:hypothetical protein